ncbi:MAG: DUF4507 domain-containing protein, partial [Acidobacteriota bacterium]|nr:DUF4507 domain-containing protein [Acidobacteriota bacterium]
MGKVTVAMMAMAPPVLLLSALLPSYLALPAGAIAGAAVFLCLLRWMRAFGAQDAERIQHIAPSLPAPARPVVDRALRWLVAG